ncbi:MAG TPA: histidine--tRNA ligase [Elusimicrobiales bacterium]|nr:histidine--tRNA ligase [Elusimicrobiales bacterium]HPO95740.1 histidine--tRNA ligase [Elusimicrobiales bacterium]
MNTVRGFKDIIYPESFKISEIERISREVFEVFNYKEIRIPTVEYQELFIKSTGETTDIVEKEMYKFEDASKRILALRPEGTPGVARAYINNNLNIKGENTKYFYIGNMFRAERPQAGRFREFEQIGAEYIGTNSAFSDAEVIIMLDTILKKIGIKSYQIEINSIGCFECRKKYREVLIENLKKLELCDLCKQRIERNPLRVLDCKIDKEKFSSIPSIHLCGNCQDHHKTLKELLTKSNVDYKENKLLVRGLDYYTRTVFEFKTAELGSQDAIAAGGRYDDLIKSMGGPNSPSVGWAMGAERILMLCEKENISFKNKPLCFVITADQKYSEYAFELLSSLRNSGIKSDFSSFHQSLKSQMRSANSNGARYALIIGEEEFISNTVTIKDLSTGEQSKKEKDNLIKELLKII